MAEPHTVAAASAVPLITVFISIFGPSFGPYVLISIGALCGSFWALTSAPTMTRWQAALLAIRATMLSILLTVAVAEILSDAFGWQLSEMYILVSIAIAALGDRWISILDSLQTSISTAISGIFKKKESP